MLSAINHTVGNFQSLHQQQDAVEPQRRKRSIEATQAQLNTVDFSGPAANDRRKNGGTLDSLGQGRLL